MYPKSEFSFYLTLLSQAMKFGFIELISWRQATRKGCPALASPLTCSKSMLPSTLGRTGRLTSLLETNSGGKDS